MATFAALPVSASERLWITTYSEWYAGRPTANGETFNYYGYTAAHPWWPFGTLVRVSTKRGSTVVRINDRCDCSLDLAYGAMRDIGGHGNWSGNARVEVIKWGR